MPGFVDTDRSGRMEPHARPLATGRDRAQGQRPGAYYDIPMLRPPPWRWEIASYFFFGGLSSGAFLLARLAERATGRRRPITRTGTLLALATALPCAPLLIKDLGDPRRFHHMLRVWKPGSPMNLGTWLLTGYSAVVGVSALAELRAGRARDEGRGGVLSALRDLVGLPLALGMTGYTGLLLSSTANPLWCRNRWLGPLFSSSAINSGAQALSLLQSLSPVRERERHHKALDRAGTVAQLVEIIALQGFLREAGEAARPLREGAQARSFKLGHGGLLAATVLKHLPVPARLRRHRRVLASSLGLASSYLLRWAIVHGGRAAAEDPDIARIPGQKSATPR